MNIVRDSRGFTLLEVILAVSIFSIALLLFSAYFVQSFTVSKTNDRELVAMNLARQYAEQYKHEEYTVLNGLTSPLSFPIELNDSSYMVEIILEKINPLPKQSGGENIIENSEVTGNPILITVNIRLDGASSILATVHSMVVDPERTS